MLHLKSIVAEICSMHFPLRLEEYADLEMDWSSFYGSFRKYYSDAEDTMVTENVGVSVYSEGEFYTHAGKAINAI